MYPYKSPAAKHPARALTGLLLLLLVGAAACSKYGGPCEEPIRANDAYLLITFKDTAGRYLYEEFNPLYPKDSLKIIGPDGQEVELYFNTEYITTTRHYYQVGLHIYKFPADDVSFSREVCKKFVIQYRSSETDTLSTCFRSEKRRCGSKLSYLTVDHQGTRLLQVENTVSDDITIIKR